MEDLVNHIYRGLFCIFLKHFRLKMFSKRYPQLPWQSEPVTVEGFIAHLNIAILGGKTN